MSSGSLKRNKVECLPCQVHRLDTFLENNCKPSPIISDFIDVLENIYLHFVQLVLKDPVI